ncbi:efflux transporter outer membrane subunit [Nitratidesulfovibrio vulgaris]|uniref:RND efflux system, outer membrane lipoprotein, NodT family n=1 Tax=Nitratidesulfovibrio vulgaris (strain DP4) TaxID=391774 RepID=A0A0H3AC41_NITV4|nr:efflux transporter outer membrane subunit [Nitratidesulfovibrio vulgaris]ABM29910.1 RND efflux system, outer membrane lipoprotein, NodT family [Nitratidesulfovibrio vulgaris DP4]GEB81372.1 RND transporter [Desulfovibrio desulfuricans]
MIRRMTAMLLGAALLSGCAIGPDYQRPDMDLPSAWRAESADAGMVAGEKWWTLFGDATLDALEEEALAANGDLATAMANVDASRAQLTVATSYLLPSITGQGSSVRQRGSERGQNPPVEGREVTDLHKASALASFELDLWGKYRRAHEAARAGLLGTEAAYATVRLAVVSQVAQSYFGLRAADRQLDIARQTLTSREESLKIREARFNSGLTSELDYRQAQAETASARASVRQLEQAVAAAETALSSLLGRSPRDIVERSPERGLDIETFAVPPQIPAGLPAGLLARRPDVARAEADLHYATASIGVAKADLLPAISLTGLMGYESIDLTRLVSSSSGTWSYGASATMPLLDFGRTLANIDMADAKQRAALAAYEQAVRDAFRETQDALVANRKTRQVVDAQATQVAALERSLTLARLRYENGYSSYLEVLDAERSLFQAQLNLVEARRNQLDAVVQVCKSLGGGWKAPGEEGADATGAAEAASGDADDAAPQGVAPTPPRTEG